MIIGSRKSDLAVIQAESIAAHLKLQNPNLQIEFFRRPSMGDLNLDMALHETQSKGVFTADFVEHLQNKDCDLVVHSWKDLPISESSEFVIIPGPYREDQRDMIFLKKESYGKEILKVLTSSPRREFQIQYGLQDLLPFETQFKFESIRGNIPTRFKKFLDSDCDAFVVAKAAVDRLYAGDRDTYKEIQGQIQDVFNACRWMVLPLSEFPTAAAQGALAIEMPESSPYRAQVERCAGINIKEAVDLERQTHKSYGGGCHQAMGFSAMILEQGQLFYSLGKEGDQFFKKQQWKPHRQLPQKFSRQDAFLSSDLKMKRQQVPMTYQEQGPSEYIFARFESYPLSMPLDMDSVVWSAGVRTWKKMAHAGIWVNGTLDGLGIDHKPQIELFKDYDKYWFTHVDAPETDLGDFNKIAAYQVEYEIDPEMLKDKKIFFWSSGQLFRKALEICPQIQSAYHVCGLGRTSKTLQAHIKDFQLYYALNEEDFLDLYCES